MCYEGGTTECYRTVSIVAKFIDQGTEQNETTSMTRVHTPFSEIFSDVIGDTEQRPYIKEALGSLQIMVKVLKRMLIEMFYRLSNSGLYIPSFHIREHIIENVHRFRKISVLDRSSYENITVHIKKSQTGKFARVTNTNGSSRKCERGNLLRKILVQKSELNIEKRK